jgi:hypothetical protein
VCVLCMAKTFGSSIYETVFGLRTNITTEIFESNSSDSRLEEAIHKGANDSIVKMTAPKMLGLAHSIRA